MRQQVQQSAQWDGAGLSTCWRGCPGGACCLCIHRIHVLATLGVGHAGGCHSWKPQVWGHHDIVALSTWRYPSRHVALAMILHGPAMHSKPRTGCWCAKANTICITSHSVFKQFASNQQIITRNMLCKMGQLGQAMTVHDIAQTLAYIQQDGSRQNRACTETQWS